MSNPFSNRNAALSDPARDLVPVIPSDSAELEHVAVALYVEGAGTLSFVTVSGAVRSVNVADFSILPVGVRRVNATGTTATAIHAFSVI